MKHYVVLHFCLKNGVLDVLCNKNVEQLFVLWYNNKEFVKGRDNMKKKSIFTLIVLAMLMILISCTNTAVESTINIVINDYEKNEIYNDEIKTEETKLIEVLKELDIELKYEDGQYGAYIISIKGLEQKEDENGIYYWSYYVDDNYATTGVSACNVEEGKKYTFNYEYYEY